MSKKGMRGYTGDSVPTNRVIRSRSFVITQSKPKFDTKSGKHGKVSISYDVDKYLAWLDR